MVNGERHITKPEEKVREDAFFPGQRKLLLFNRGGYPHGKRDRTAMTATKRGASISAMFVFGAVVGHSQVGRRYRLVLSMPMLTVTARDAGKQQEV